MIHKINILRYLKIFPMYKLFSISCLVILFGSTFNVLAVDKETLSRAENTQASEFKAIGKGTVDVEGGIIQLAAQKDGVIREVFVNEGDKVKKDQVLAIQESRPAKLALELQRSEVEQQKAQLKILNTKLEASLRQSKLYQPLAEIEAQPKNDYLKFLDEESIIKAEIEAAKVAIDISKQHLKAAEIDVEQYKIRSPMDAIILKKMARPGVGASTLNVTALFWLIPDTDKIVRIQLEEKYLSKVKIGDNADIFSELDENKNFKAKVIRLGKVLSPKNVSIEAMQDAFEDKFVECILKIESGSALLIGQNVIVKFRNE